MHKINISIDDVSPHPMSSTKILDRCYSIIERVPSVKFTLFIPIAYWRTVGPTATVKPLWINLFDRFCETLRCLDVDRFELAYHGLYHGIPGVSNNDEFQALSYDDALKTFKTMISITQELRLPFKSVFRPPAWRMSPSAIAAASDAGIDLLALASYDYALATYADAQNGKNVVYCTSSPPILPLVKNERSEIVYHACEWDQNYLSSTAADELVTFLRSIDDAQYTFIGDL